jgi:type II secretory pathway pseudopilin PulG
VCRMRCGKHRAREGGFTYIGLLVLIALIGFALSVVGQVAATTAQREREKQLLWVGHAYRDAIRRYVMRNGRYPPTLADLVQSATATADPLPAHFLRRLYPDPMTQGADWVLVPALDGGIMGVASSSTKAPIKRAGFDDADVAFGDAETYGDWTFIFDLRRRWGQGPQGVRGIGTVQPTAQPTQ